MPKTLGPGKFPTSWRPTCLQGDDLPPALHSGVEEHWSGKFPRLQLFWSIGEVLVSLTPDLDKEVEKFWHLLAELMGTAEYEAADPAAGSPQLATDLPDSLDAACPEGMVLDDAQPENLEWDPLGLAPIPVLKAHRPGLKTRSGLQSKLGTK